MMAQSLTEEQRAPAPDRVAAVVLDSLSRLPTPPAWMTDLPDSDSRARRHAATSLAGFAGGVFGRPLFSPLVRRLDTNGHWRHAFEVAAIAEAIDARSCARGDPTAVFTAALLHDIGKLALDHCLPKSYARVRRESAHRRIALSPLEWIRLGVDHARVGGRVAARWNLPERIVDAIAFHHDVPTSPHGGGDSATLGANVRLANMLSHREPAGHPDRPSPCMLESTCRLAGLSPQEMDAAVDDALARSQALYDSLAPLLTADGAGRSSDSAHAAPRVASVATSFRSPRSRWLAAVTRFASRSSPDDSSATVCALIVDACSEVFGAATVAAYVRDPRSDLYHCGVRHDGVTDSTILLLPQGTEPDAERFLPHVVSLVAPALGPPPPSADPVLERFRHLLDAESIVMLPIIQGRSPIGGILFDAALIAADDADDVRGGIEALAVAFGAAAGHAVRRAEIGRASDVLAQANQRRVADRTLDPDARVAAVIGETAAGAAHELNTPLAVISGRAQVLAATTDDADRRRALESIYEASHTCSEIVNELMAFAKPDRPDPSLIVLGTWFGRLYERWRARSWSTDISLTVGFADPSLRAWADPGQIEILFDGVIANAVEAMSGSEGRLVINSPSRASDDTVVIVVNDNGRGMSSDVLERACDPFFSHRDAGRGRGLGLSIARRLAQANHGRLWLESATGAGTTVFVELPARDAAFQR